MTLYPVHAKIGTHNLKVVYCTKSVYEKERDGKLNVGDIFEFRYENNGFYAKVRGFVTQIRTENTILMISL